MIQFIFLLITRVVTLVPLFILLGKQTSKFRDKKRDMKLERTRQSLFLINIALFAESIIFGIYDIYRILHYNISPTPIVLIFIWCVIRITLLLGVWRLFGLLFEENI